MCHAPCWLSQGNHGRLRWLSHDVHPAVYHSHNEEQVKETLQNADMYGAVTHQYLVSWHGIGNAVADWLSVGGAPHCQQAVRREAYQNYRQQVAPSAMSRPEPCNVAGLVTTTSFGPLLKRNCVVLETLLSAEVGRLGSQGGGPSSPTFRQLAMTLSLTPLSLVAGLPGGTAGTAHALLKTRSTDTRQWDEKAVSLYLLHVESDPGRQYPAPCVVIPSPSLQGSGQALVQGELGLTDCWGGQLQVPAGHCSENPQSVLLVHCWPASNAATRLGLECSACTGCGLQATRLRVHALPSMLAGALDS